MKIQTLLAAVLGLLLISGLSLSQESVSPEPTPEATSLVESPSPEPLQEEPASRSPSPAKPLSGRRSSRARAVREFDLYGPDDISTSDARRRSRTGSSYDEMVMKVFKLEYYPVEELEHLIENIFSIDDNKIQTNPGFNTLIIQAPVNQMKDVETLITKLDVPDSKLESNRVLDNLVYRVFMFEIPSSNQNLKPFSMILQTPSQVSSTALLNIAKDNGIQVSDFLVIDERDSENDILIQGKAPSNESIIQMVEEISDSSRIKELKWDDDETFTGRIEAAHFSRLPGQILTHIQKFLGEDIVTVGYWFGNSSIPGEIEAPIGPWRLQLELSPESDRALELRVEVQVPEERSHFDRWLGHEKSDVILSNTILTKTGKPIIVGYNRQSYGTRKMGAMVIIPETDTIEAEGN